MIIKKMRASFGRLHETLELKPGMNLLLLPNEAGKSTWSAFLVAMLYGIDTSERASSQNQGLPAKERYKPWDGRAMEGSIELEWQGRNITIERTTERRVPMGAFRAYETDGGAPVPELTGENCGRMLCGVERSVFERTAFIHQSGLPVTGDAALEKRLNALVATGEDNGKSYSQLEGELKKYQNRLSGRTGKLSRLTAEADRLRRTLQELHTMQEEAMTLQAQVTAAREKKETLEQLHQARQWAVLKKLQEDAAQQEALCRQLREEAVLLPEDSALYDLQQALESSEQTLQAAKMDAAIGVAEPEIPSPPPCFSDLGGQSPEEKAQTDQEMFLRLTEKTRSRGLPLLLAGVALLLCGLVLALLDCNSLLWVVLCAGSVSTAAALLLNAGQRRTQDAHRRQAAAIAAPYGDLPPAQWSKLAADYTALLEEAAQRRQAAASHRRHLSAEVANAELLVAEQLAVIVRFAPAVKTPAEGRAAITAALHTHARLENEERSLAQMRRQCDSLALLLRGDAPAEAPPPAETINETRLNDELRRISDELEILSRQLAARQGAISMLGDPTAMEAHLEEIEEAIAAAQLQSEAATLALSALKTADSALRARFSPQITADAGALLAELTAGKYPNVLLEPGMRLSVRESEGVVMRPAAAMSCGTADQMYLALRLAMCRRLLPEDVPLILDDALVYFDDERAKAALQLLETLSQTRQILFFSCRAFQKNSASDAALS